MTHGGKRLVRSRRIQLQHYTFVFCVIFTIPLTEKKMKDGGLKVFIFFVFSVFLFLYFLSTFLAAILGKKAKSCLFSKREFYQSGIYLR